MPLGDPNVAFAAKIGAARAQNEFKGSGWGPQSTRPPFLLEYMAFKVGRSESSIFYIRAHESFYHKEIQ